MPQIKRKTFKAAAKEKGLTPKQTRQSFRAETKTLNGGKTRAGRLIKGAIKVGAAALPGIGSSIADALMGSGETKVDAATLPIFAPANVGQTLGDAATQQGATNNPTANTPPVINPNTLPPALQTPSQVSRTIIEGDGGNSGNSIADDANKQDTQTKAAKVIDITENTTPKETPQEPKKNNKIWFIVGGAILVGMAIYFISKKK